MRGLFTCSVLLAAALPLPARAQEVGVRVRVVDSLGTPIPYAVVQPANGASRVASDSGIAEFRLALRDSMKVVVRRIGYLPFGGWVTNSRATDTGGEFVVRLVPAPRSLRTVTIEERLNTPLARAGFYDRMERVRRGAVVGVFITPEELEVRSPSRISQMLAGLPSLKLHRYSDKAVLSGRTGSCPVTVLIDGRKMAGMAEEIFTWDGQREIERMGGGDGAVHRFLQARTTIDEVISTAGISAVEVYSNANSIPAELLQNAGQAPCALVAFWTGSRR